MNKKIKMLVFLDELFFTNDYSIYKSKFVSINFLKKFQEKYKDEIDLSYSFPVSQGDLDDFGSFIESNHNIYPVNGWGSIIEYYKKLSIIKLELKKVVENSDKMDIVFIRIPSPAGMYIGELFSKRGSKVIYNVVSDIKNTHYNYKFPLNIPAYILGKYLFYKELSLDGSFLTVGSVLTKRFEHKKAEFFIDTLVNKKDLHTIKHSLSKPIKILYVGRLLETKGVFFLIEAIKELSPEFEIELQIVGFGKNEKEVKELSTKYTFIKFHGKIGDRGKLNTIYKNADIFVLPTFMPEGFPRVILEAWANGLYVISSKVGGIEGLAKDKKNILFFKSGNKEDFNKQLKSLINDKHLREILQQGITDIQQKVTFEYQSEIVYKQIKETLCNMGK